MARARGGQGQARASAARTPDPPTKAPPRPRAGPSVAGWRSAPQGTAGPLRSVAGCSAPLVERPTMAPRQLDEWGQATVLTSLLGASTA